MKKICVFVMTLILMLTCAALAEAPDPDDFSGAWACDRAGIEMIWEEEGYRIRIEWSSSDLECTVWEYSGFYHEDSNTVVTMPFGARTDLVYGEDGEVVSVTDVYDDGEAVFSIDEEGYLIWDDEKENAGEGMRFEKMPWQPERWFDTLGEAFDEAEYEGFACEYEDSYVIIVEQNGMYIRVVAQMDDEARALSEAMYTADDYEVARAAFDEYIRNLPVLYTEELTAEPVDQAELDSYIGKTIAELAEAGFEVESSENSGADDDVLFFFANGLYCYRCVVNETSAEYEAHSENDTLDDLTVKSIEFYGASRNAVELRYHADGTVDPEEDIWGQFNSLIETVTDVIAEAGESGETDVEKIVDKLVEMMPDQSEDDIRSLVQMVLLFAGAEAEAE